MVSDRFHRISLHDLAKWIFSELDNAGSILGLSQELFFAPAVGDPFTQSLYGHHLDTPIGMAAGPHTQLAQNIVLAWLCGARVIELKTVQLLDELEIDKPCISMVDEGYNVEWSQELRLEHSADEYVRAWVLVHALHRLLGHPGSGPGALFNLSVGYDLAGVQSPAVRRFVATMLDAGELINEQLRELCRLRPELEGLEVPRQIANSVTLSTMHGCPPQEIGRISAFLMHEWGLHTSVKLNPTLLGPHDLREILNRKLGYEHVVVPDAAFEHDIDFDSAVQLLRELHAQAERLGLDFGVKLSNTLEVVNDGSLLPGEGQSMYLSGRPLHALTVTAAQRLNETFNGRLLMSFAGGADAFNVARLLAAGMRTVTTCSDILRPGGYSRLLQYLDCIRDEMQQLGSGSLHDFVLASDAAAREKATAGPVHEAARRNLARYAAEVVEDPLLKRDTFERHGAKTSRRLALFDCIQAPCSDACFVDQQVPDYMRAVARGDDAAAIAVTRENNPLPTVLGHACNHPCEPVCLRTHYDQPLAIRELKRFIMSREGSAEPSPDGTSARETQVAVIGGGPCGLSAATFLSRAGYGVTIFESRSYSGGMVAGTIPAYRADDEVMNHDLEAVRALGVETRHGKRMGTDFGLADLRAEGFAHVVLATGAQQGIGIGIPGEEGDGVFDGLEFLRTTKHGQAPELGTRVAVIGGGDVAMDCARTARRLTGASVKVLYRRSRGQMPAQDEEVADLIAEGIELVELVAPEEIVRDDQGLQAVRLVRMELGEPDASGRRRPLAIPGSSFELPLDSLIVAIGQRPNLGFLADEGVRLTGSGHVDVDPETRESSVEGVWAGGDAILGGPQSIVRACGDGRRIAATIRRREEGEEPESAPAHDAPNRVDLLRRRAHRSWRVPTPRLPAGDRDGFIEVVGTLDETSARKEAARCLHCDLMCSTCEGVCPNHAIFSYQSRPTLMAATRMRMSSGELQPVAESAAAIEQRLQVAVLTDFCNECGNCVAFCPTAGSPYLHKPRIYLHRGDFEAEADNAFMIFHDDGAWSIEGRFAGRLHRLELDEIISYSAPGVRVELNEALEVTAATAELADGENLDLGPCYTMFVLLRSIRDSMPWLPTATR